MEKCLLSHSSTQTREDYSSVLVVGVGLGVGSSCHAVMDCVTTVDYSSGWSAFDVRCRYGILLKSWLFYCLTIGI